MNLEPSPALLRSMALRYDHSFGLLADDDPRRSGILTIMRQLWEEVAGEGFYQGPDTIKGLITPNRLEVLQERNKLREDLIVAAGEYRVPMPLPGTHMARLLSANVLLRRECEDLRTKLIDLQVQIGDLIPAVDGERANDPMIGRVRRVVEELSTAERFFAGWNSKLLASYQERSKEPLTIDTLHYSERGRLRVYISARHQTDGSVRWVVENEGFILCPIGTQGFLAFCLESMPSNRTDEWMAQTRHKTKEDARAAFQRFLDQTWNQYLDRRDPDTNLNPED